MAYDEDLGNRIREHLEHEKGLTERRMFGGLAFMINGHMAVSAGSQGGLLLRVDPVETDSLVQEPHVGRFVMRGREMDGWLRVDPQAFDTDAQFARWLRIGVSYARSLPPK
jgi:hypothetical protein